MSRKALRPAHDLDVVDAEPIGESRDPTRTPPGGASQHDARDGLLPRASLSLALSGEGPLLGTPSFFRAAEQQLLSSTEHGLELAGAAFVAERNGKKALVGLARKGAGQPGRVAVSSSWGEVLWHTHPGLRGTLAAFSNEDLAAAKAARRPLLVIGFGGLSPEVLTTFALPLGVRGLVLSSGLKGLMSLEKRGVVPAALLRVGVAARVCYPSGRIAPVLRTHASPWRHAIEDMAFVVDRSVGALERTGQAALKRVFAELFGP